MELQKKAHNNSIDIFRYVAALLIVAHHTDVLADIHPMLSYLVSQVLPRIGVPFFCAVAGYFYTSKLEAGKGGYWNYIKRLLKTYTLWSLIYVAVDIVGGNFHLGTAIANYLFFGSAYHFWFFPALILAVSIFTLMHWLGLHKLLVPLSLVLYLIGCFSHAYYKIGAEIPVLAALYQIDNWRWISHVFTLGFPCFILGYVLVLTRKHWESVRGSSVIAAVMLAVFLGEIFLLKILDWARTTTQSVGLYLFVYALLVCLLLHPMPMKTRAARVCKVLANTAYYAHVLFIMLFNELNVVCFGGGLTYTAKFLFVFLLTLMLGTILYRFNGKVAKALTA